MPLLHVTSSSFFCSVSKVVLLLFWYSGCCCQSIWLAFLIFLDQICWIFKCWIHGLFCRKYKMLYLSFVRFRVVLRDMILFSCACWFYIYFLFYLFGDCPCVAAIVLSYQVQFAMFWKAMDWWIDVVSFVSYLELDEWSETAMYQVR